MEYKQFDPRTNYSCDDASSQQSNYDYHSKKFSFSYINNLPPPQIYHSSNANHIRLNNEHSKSNAGVVDCIGNNCAIINNYSMSDCDNYQTIGNINKRENSSQAILREESHVPTFYDNDSIKTHESKASSINLTTEKCKFLNDKDCSINIIVPSKKDLKSIKNEKNVKGLGTWFFDKKNKRRSVYYSKYSFSRK